MLYFIHGKIDNDISCTDKLKNNGVCSSATYIVEYVKVIRNLGILILHRNDVKILKPVYRFSYNCS